MKKNFIIYASAINSKSAGAHSILVSFLSSLEVDPDDSWLFLGNFEYETLCKRCNVQFIETNLNSKWLKRIVYDFFLFKFFYLKTNNSPVTIISMQNTTPAIRKIDFSLTYLHQAIPFIDTFKPHPVKQWKIFLIKHFYYYFIQKGISDKQSFFIVQSEWLKNIIAKKLRIPLKHIFIHRPLPEDIKDITFEKIASEIFFYPAIYQEYKNHDRLISAFILAAKENPLRNFTLALTLEEHQLKSILAMKEALPSNFHIMNYGVLTRLETLEKINNAKAIIFPSLIESYGMPLAEALFLKTPVIASNLPYAQELLGESGHYFEPLNTNSIKDSILQFDINNNLKMALPASKFQNWRDILESFNRR